MTEISQDIQVDLVLSDINVFNRRQAFEILAKEISLRLEVPHDQVLEALHAKEQISTSGIGDGVAIPHVKLKNLPHRFSALAVLNNKIDFAAADNKPVDLICLLASPEHEGPQHLRRLARMSRLLQNHELRKRIREVAPDASGIRSLLAMPQEWMIAA